jgi:lysophospholipase L1-like esterase
MRLVNNALLLVFAPCLVWQAARLRRTVARLPEAAGARSGRADRVAGQPGNAIHVLVAGESTAVGVGTTHLDDALAGHFARALAAREGVDVTWQVLGANGLNAQGLAAMLGEPESLLVPAPDIVLLVLGVNDTVERTSTRGFVRTVASLVAGVQRTQERTLVVLCGVPPMGQFPALPQPLRFVLGRLASDLDYGLAALAASQIDVCHVPTPRGADASLFARDGYHPNGEGYRVWSEALCRALPELQRSRAMR